MSNLIIIWIFYFLKIKPINLLPLIDFFLIYFFFKIIFKILTFFLIKKFCLVTILILVFEN